MQEEGPPSVCLLECTRAEWLQGQGKVGATRPSRTPPRRPLRNHRRHPPPPRYRRFSPKTIPRLTYLCRDLNNRPFIRYNSNSKLNNNNNNNNSKRTHDHRSTWSLICQRMIHQVTSTTHFYALEFFVAAVYRLPNSLFLSPATLPSLYVSLSLCCFCLSLSLSLSTVYLSLCAYSLSSFPSILYSPTLVRCFPSLPLPFFFSIIRLFVLVLPIFSFDSVHLRSYRYIRFRSSSLRDVAKRHIFFLFYTLSTRLFLRS